MAFSDIGKFLKHLFDDDYAFSKKIAVKTKNDSDFEVETEGELLAKGTQASVTIKRAGLPLSLDKIRIKSDGRVLVEGSYSTSPVSKFTISAEDGRQEPGKPLQSFGKLGCSFALPNADVSADIDVVNGPTLRASALMFNKNKQINGGFEVLLNSRFEEKESPELSDANVGFSYSSHNWRLSARTFDLFSSMRLGYVQSYSPNILIGTMVDYHLKSNAQKIAVGTQVRLPPYSDR